MKKLELLWENDDFLFVNKPSGILVIPDRFNSALNDLKTILSEQLQKQLFVVHRIDRDTSGVLCFAKNEKAHQFLSIKFEQRQVNKEYLGIVFGRLSSDHGIIEKKIAPHPTKNGKMIINSKGKASVTEYHVEKQWSHHALLRFNIRTGRTHQIRVHMHDAGHALVADPLYGSGKAFFLSQIKKNYKISGEELEERPMLSRLALHAHKLSFTDTTGNEISVTAPLPKDMAASINQLDKWGH